MAALTEIETASGRYVDLALPDSATIDLVDIAHGLAHTCRYNGHVSRFYSVAEHACLVAWRLLWLDQPPHVQLRGLHHDDAEAYLGDVTRPLKSLLPAYRDLESVLQSRIELALELPILNDRAQAAVKAADDWALFVEARDLMASRGKGWIDAPDEVDPSPWTLGGKDIEMVRRLWLERHRYLTAQAGLT